MPLINKIKCIILSLLLFQANCYAIDEPTLPKEWSALGQIIIDRQEQDERKMNLNAYKVASLLAFLNSPKSDKLIQLQLMQKQLPKTTLELLLAIQRRGLDTSEAEKMAAYLQTVPAEYHIRNIEAFDEKTSHIIGREWHEIDYSGEGTTWSEQRAKYAPYGIANFKTLESLKKFYPVESKMPYFQEAYDERKNITSDK